MTDQQANNVPDKSAKDGKAAPIAPIDAIEDDGTLDGCGEPAVGIENLHQEVPRHQPSSNPSKSR